MCLTKKWIKKWEDDFAKNINATNYSSEHYKKIIVSSSKMTSKLINKNHSNWRKHKKYQYLYLQKKIDFIEMEDCFHTESTLFNEELGQSLSKEEWEKWEQNGIKIICKIKKYRKWLGKINRKYNYA